MKKLLLVLGLLVLMGSASFAMLDVAVEAGQLSINSTSYTGYGLQVGLPILPIPMVNSRIEVMYFAIDSNSSFTPISINADYSIPLSPIYVGGGVGYLLYNNSSAGFTAPGALIYNAHVGYQHDLAPLTSAFAQIGYEGGSMTYTIANTSYTLGLNGMSIKGGLRIGL